MARNADYRAWVEILPEFKDFNSTVRDQVVGGMGGAGTRGADAMNAGLLAGVGRLAGPLIAAIGALGIANAIGDAVKAGIDAAIAYTSGAVGLAAELEQAVGAVDAVFKDQAGAIHEWGQASAQAMGLSTKEYLEFATLVGAQLKNMGIPMDEVGERTNWLITLGADLAAQFGGSTADAVSALSSLLRGERDPIERYGVGIKQADINARLAAQGLDGLTGSAARQAEIMATLELLTEQTADAQGTFGRESETLMNQQQRLRAEFENVQAALGMQLLPVLTEVMTFVAEELMPVWREFNDALGPQVKAALEASLPTFLELAETVLPLIIQAMPFVIAGIVYFINVIETAAAQLNLFAVAVDSFFKYMSGEIGGEEFKRRVGAAFDKLMEMPSGFEEVERAAIESVGALNKGWAEGVKEAADETQALPDNAKKILEDSLDGMYSGGAALSQQIASGIRSNKAAVGAAMAEVMAEAKAYMPHSPAKKGPFSGAGWTAVKQSGQAIMRQFESGLTPVEVPLGAAFASREMQGRLGLDVGLAEQQIQNLLRSRRLPVDVDVRGRVGRRTL